MSTPCTLARSHVPYCTEITCHQAAELASSTLRPPTDNLTLSKLFIFNCLTFSWTVLWIYASKIRWSVAEPKFTVFCVAFLTFAVFPGLEMIHNLSAFLNYPELNSNFLKSGWLTHIARCVPRQRWTEPPTLNHSLLNPWMSTV